MTISNVISSQSVGTSTNIGEGKFPQKVTLTGGTTAFTVEARLVNGAAGYAKQDVRVWYAVSSFDVTAAASVVTLRNAARYLDIFFGKDAAADTARMSLLEPAAGLYLYLWVDIPTVNTAATLYVNVIEVP